MQRSNIEPWPGGMLCRCSLDILGLTIPGPLGNVELVSHSVLVNQYGKLTQGSYGRRDNLAGNIITAIGAG